MRIGDILVASGIITQSGIERALDRQKEEGGRLGDNLIALGLITEQQLESILHELPQPPRTLAETGISESELMALLIKLIYTRNLDTPSRIADEMMLSPRLVNALLAEAEKRQLVEVLGASDTGSMLSELRYSLSQAGRRRAAEALEMNQYVGPAPVSLPAYHSRILRQRITNERIGREVVEEAFADLSIPPDFVQRLGPGINSGRAILLYGPPGNGKTSIAERIGRIFNDIIYIPYCVEVEGQLIKVFDPNLHEIVPKMQSERSGAIRREEIDRRWVPCQRPIVITGGELTLEMLDLQFNPQARFYEAPLHVKALGGTFIIDDFGRQLVQPEQLLNRWIVPMQSRVDFLKLHTGKSFSLPFDELLIFSTNMDPQDLMDPAFLRRIPYKLETTAPSTELYYEIFRGVAESEKLELTDDVFRYVLDRLGTDGERTLACYQPRFIVDQVIAACKYENVPPEFSIERVGIALDNLYTKRSRSTHPSPHKVAGRSA